MLSFLTNERLCGATQDGVTDLIEVPMDRAHEELLGGGEKRFCAFIAWVGCFPDGCSG
ncbi:MAG: hypothetical protein AAGA48_32945 [Myxococcota bacterium]